MNLAVKSVWLLVAVILLLAVALLIAGRMGWLRGTAPIDFGVQDGRLKPPARTPNSVSSQAALHPDHPQRQYAQIEPFRYSGDGVAAMAKLSGIIEQYPRTLIVVRNADYLRAESSTALLQFTDDVELWLDEANQAIQVRSASRIGRSDWGANRKRVEELRARFSG